MQENFRLFFSILWLIALGCSFAFGLATVVSWGGFAEYFYAALIVLGVATVGTIVSSL